MISLSIHRFLYLQLFKFLLEFVLVQFDFRNYVASKFIEKVGGIYRVLYRLSRWEYLLWPTIDVSRVSSPTRVAYLLSLQMLPSNHYHMNKQRTNESHWANIHASRSNTANFILMGVIMFEEELNVDYAHILSWRQWSTLNKIIT